MGTFLQRMPLAVFPLQHLQQHISICLLSHAPPAVSLRVHLLHPDACRYFISRLELGCCQLTCLPAVLALCVLLSPSPKVSGLGCDWHVAGHGLSLRTSHCRPQSGGWKLKLCVILAF